MSRIQTLDRPVTTINLEELRGETIPNTIFQRGLKLYQSDLVEQNSLYPWKYRIQGRLSELGIPVYFTDIAKMECGCMWNENTGRICKHLVAALLHYLNQQKEQVTS